MSDDTSRARNHRYADAITAAGCFSNHGGGLQDDGQGFCNGAHLYVKTGFGVVGECLGVVGECLGVVGECVRCLILVKFIIFLTMNVFVSVFCFLCLILRERE